MANNPRYYALINTERWRRLRRAKLSRDPLCEDCKAKGIIRAATEVHHVTPVLAGMTPSQMARLAYDPHNLRSLCRECHTETHRRMGRHAAPLEEWRRRFMD